METRKVDKSVQTCNFRDNTETFWTNIEIKDKIKHFEKQISVQNMENKAEQNRDRNDSTTSSHGNENDDSVDSSNTYTRNKTFKKKVGTGDVGEEYENLYVTNVLLKLSTDDNVKDYLLSSNNPEFGSFDDVVIEITYRSGHTKIYALQLKHKDAKSLTIESLKNGRFKVQQYLDSFKTLSYKEIKTIFLTNAAFSVNEGTEIAVNPEVKATVGKVVKDQILTTSDKRHCYQLKLKNLHSASEENRKFFNNFFLYTNETNASQLYKDTSNKFQEMFNCDEHSFDAFFKFIKQWSMIKKEKKKLDKKWINRVIALSALSPFIKPLSFSGAESTENEQTFRKCISKFRVTTFSEESYDTVKGLWKDVLENIEKKEIYHIRSKYQLSENDESDKENTKVLWLLGKCPLIVNGSKTAHSIINFCNDVNFILLGPTISLSSNFQTLLDLQTEPEVYEKVLNTFMCSIQGKYQIPLKDLVESEEEVQYITTDELVQMIDKPLLISRDKEHLPPCHLLRKLSRIVVDSSFLKSVNEEILVIISCVKNMKMLRQQFKVKMIDVKYIKYYSKTASNQPVVYVSEEKLSQEDFDNLTTDLRQQRCHHFRYLDEKYLEWVRSTNGVNDLRKYRLEQLENYWIEETDLFTDFHFDINIICADPGMGKSTLMKSLRNSSSPTSWTILINANGHASYFHKGETDAESFLLYILEKENAKGKNFDKKILHMLRKKRRIHLIWDGLDEVSSKNLETVLNIIESISCKGLKQWVTSRNNLKEKLELRFNVFSRRMKQFDLEEQDKYIRNRLKVVDDSVFQKIKNNVQLAPNNDILGIPLQIYMLTELFLQGQTKKYCKLLNDTFSIADLYHHFVEEKFRIHYNDKEKWDLDNETVSERVENDKTKMIQRYKKMAFCKFIDEEKFSNLRPDCTELFKEIRTDPVGFIVEVSNGVNPYFAHNSLGEYFAALYFYDNMGKVDQIQDLIFNDRCNNIRLFLDMMMSENCKAHIAVLYKNIKLLQRCTKEELEQKNKAGSSALDLACQWGKKYPLLTTKVTDGTYSLNDESDVMQQFENLDVLKFLSKKCKIDPKFVFCYQNSIILFPFLILVCSNQIDISAIDSQYIPTILYYALLFDYSEVFTFIKEVPVVKNFSGKGLLELGIEWKSANSLKHMVRGQNYVNAFKNNRDLLYNLCNCEFEAIFLSLLNSGVDIDATDANDKTLLQYSSEKKDYEAAKFLLKNGADVNVCNSKGETAMHFASDSDAYEIVKLLIENGARLDPVHTSTNKMPIHYASDKKNYKVLRLLTENGASVDVADVDGRTPLHKACIDGRYDIVKLLIENGAKLNPTDKQSKKPIHYVCSSQRVSYHVIELLIKSGADVVGDEDGKTPLHHACDFGSYEVVQLLLTTNVDLNVSDCWGKTPLHYACIKGDLGLVKLLLGRNVRVDVVDNEGKKAVDYAPVHIKQRLSAAGHGN